MHPPVSNGGSRIFGGENAKEGNAKYQCSLQENKEHFCGCSVISEELIITAGHCIAGKSTSNLEILVGTIDLKNGGTYYKADKLIAHEGYNRPQYANDIALVRVKDTIQFSDKVQPIELLKEEVADGAELKLTGWGRLQVSYFLIAII